MVVEESEVRRRNIAPVRHALSGYQDGHCFYSALPIEHDGDNVCHVDHLIPHKFQKHMAELGVNVDGVWNLVLAEAGVNLSKSDRVPDLQFLEKLSARNEFYIASKHPLAETIVNQTGRTTEIRRAFLELSFGWIEQVAALPDQVRLLCAHCKGWCEPKAAAEVEEAEQEGQGQDVMV